MYYTNTSRSVKDTAARDPAAGRDSASGDKTTRQTRPLRAVTACTEALLLAQLREAKTQGMMETGNTGDREGMEEGEEPTFTLAEETKRQLRREERKKKKADEFQRCKEYCECPFALLPHSQH